MWTLKVALWWAALALAKGAVWTWYRAVWVPVRLLEALCDGRDAVELAWLAACSERRLAERKRLNGFGPGGRYGDRG